MKGRIILSVKSEPRILSTITYILSKSSINIDDINYVDTGERIIIDISVDNPKKTIDILQHNGYNPQIPGKSIIIALKNQPGMLFRIIKKMDEQNIKPIRVDIISQGHKMSVISIVVDKKRKAEKILRPYII